MLNYLKALYQVMHDNKLSRSQLDQLVNKRLKTVLVSAYQHVPYYREQMQRVGYDPVHDYGGPQDLSKLPITSKQELKHRDIHDFIKKGSNPSQYRYDATSGSTGIPLRIYRTPYEKSVQTAKWLRVLFLNGYSIRYRTMAIVDPHRVSQEDSIIQRFGLFRRLTVDYIKHSIEEIVNQFLIYNPEVLYGNRAHLDLIALELRRRGIQPKGLNLKLLLAGSEVIHEGNRQLYRKQYGVEVIEFYGSWEMGGMAYETSEHDGLHLNEDLTYFEFLDQNGNPVGSGEPGRVVMTDLIGTLMPFIRYDQGDLAVFTYKENKKEAGRRIQQIIGRDNDFAVLSDGTRYPVHTFNRTVGQYEGIMQFRIIQKSFTQFQVLIVADTSYFQSIRDNLKQNLQQQFPPIIDFEIDRADQIEADPTGKIRTFISEID